MRHGHRHWLQALGSRRAGSAVCVCVCVCCCLSYVPCALSHLFLPLSLKPYMGIIMIKGGMIFFDDMLIFFNNVIEMGDEVFGHFHLVDVYFRLLSCQIFLVYFLAQLVESPEILLN